MRPTNRSRRPLTLLAALALAAPLAGCGGSDDADIVAVPAAGTAAAGTAADGSTPPPAGPAVAIDPALPAYQRAPGVSGTITSRGSDTMRSVMDYWTEGFSGVYPGVKAEIESKGSSSAPASLIEGTALFGVMSRPMKPEERQQFEAKFGYPPTELRTSRDLLAVFVNKDNPVAETGLTLPQVDAIFSANRELGEPERAERWGQVGVTGPLADQNVAVFGRNSASGTYGYFKDVALGGGDYADTVQEQSGTSGVVTAVAGSPAAIGYGGIGSATAGVRAVPLAAAEGGKFYEASVENADTGDYPLGRFLFIYVNKKPGEELSPLQREFLKYVFSREGQAKVVDAQYFPMRADEAAEELAKVGIAVASGASDSSESGDADAAVGAKPAGDAAAAGSSRPSDELDDAAE